MADIEPAVKTYLLTSSTLTGLIAKKLFNSEVHQETDKPYVSYVIITDPDEAYYIGQDGSNPIFQFDSVAKHKTTAKAIDNELRRLLHEYQGVISGITIIRSRCVGYRDFEDLDDYVHLQRDFQIQYKR